MGVWVGLKLGGGSAAGVSESVQQEAKPCAPEEVVP